MTADLCNRRQAVSYIKVAKIVDYDTLINDFYYLKADGKIPTQTFWQRCRRKRTVVGPLVCWSGNNYGRKFKQETFLLNDL